ncbi:MAG: hypothetical protein IPN76_19110 [Saprospiraceae bacterium]|nr:hypothetical protein [Saprospiraceae bacterium]
MQFKYFQQPERFAQWLAAPANAPLRSRKTCLDGTAFLGTDRFNAICPECLLSAKLLAQDSYTCEGDIEALKHQLQLRKPEKSTKAVSNKAGEITDLLERTTPPIFKHQNWYWPCAGGDYCSFWAMAPRAFSSSLASDGDGEGFQELPYHTVEDLSDVDELWEEAMPDEPIATLVAAKAMDTLFYVFRPQRGSG